MGIARIVLGILLAPGGAAVASAPVIAPPATPVNGLEWYAFHGFSSTEGLPQNSVLALHQDAQGFVYAGTEQGLARYDGRQWQVIELPTSGHRYAVGALAEDFEGALWIGTDSQGVWRVHGDRHERVELPAGGSVYVIRHEDSGFSWIGTDKGLNRCHAGRCNSVDVLAGLGVRSLLLEGVGSARQLWVGSNESGVMRLGNLDAEQPLRIGTAITREQGLPNNVGLALARFAGDLWIGSGRGLARLHDDRLEVYGAANGFPPSMVFGLQAVEQADGQSVLYVSLRPGGLARIEPNGHWKLIDSAHGLTTYAAHALMLERYRGLLWIGTMSAGVARLERDRWALFDERSGLPDRQILGVGWSPARGALWVGTAGGAVQAQGERFVPLLPSPHSHLLVYDVLDDPTGVRWIAHGLGLQRWRGDDLLDDFRVDGSALPAVSVDRLALRRAGHEKFEVYAGTGHGLARWSEADGLQRVINLPAAFEGNSILDLLVQPGSPALEQDTLWVFASTGVVKYDGHAWNPLNPGCLNGLGVASAAADWDSENGLLWLATRDGLLRMKLDGECLRWPAADDLGALSQVRLTTDALYVFGTAGVLRLDHSGKINPASRRFGRESGLSSTELHSVAVDDKGRLLGGSSQGLLALTHDALVKPNQEAPLQWLDVRFGEGSGQALSPNGSVPYGENTLQFRYALLSFEREAEIRYRTRLVGLENSATAWTARGEVAFQRLPPGEFTLVVEAKDAWNQLAKPIRFSFRVATPWWQQSWTIALAPLLLVSFGLWIGRWRLRAARQRAAALEQEVALRTSELAAANSKLEQAAITDPLTGLRNRRCFALVAPGEAERARRNAPAHALLFVLLDLDHFKAINDTHGHDAGDSVMIEIAKRLSTNARAGDFVFRWGGEEFLLLLPDMDPAEITSLLQRLLHCVATPSISAGGKDLSVTTSIGAFAFPPRENPANCTLEQAMSFADSALYRAKHAGRNRAMLMIGTDANGEPEFQEVNAMQRSEQ